MAATRKQKARKATVAAATAAAGDGQDSGHSPPAETATQIDTSAFAALGVSPESCRVLGSLGFTRPTPVQEACLPLFRGNKDVAVDACTGSGKTLAFVVPIVDRLRALESPLKKYEVGAVVVSPTRELARQINEVAEPFVSSVPGLHSMLLVGGTDPSQDVNLFREQGGQVLIGTPGRLHDIMTRASMMNLKQLEVLVLDEADRLLDMGFQRQLDAIMARLPKQRRTGLFSATQTEAVEALSRAGLRNPVRVQVAVTDKSTKASAADGEQKTPTTLSIFYMTCQSDEKMAQLLHFLLERKTEKIIVYFLTCAVVDFYLAAFARLPAAKKLVVHGLHGRMKQAARERTLSDFTSHPHGVLLATDVAARGLDIPHVNWIVQVDPPQDPSAFVHRVGRTARMGQSGSALAMLLPHEESYVEFLRLRKVPLREMDTPANVPSLLPAVKKLAESDRDVMEKGTRAFISYVRGYKEHHCRFIFRFQELDLGSLALAFALLRLPKMSEIKRAKSLADFVPSDVDPSVVQYQDKAREKQRQKTLAAWAQQRQEEEAARLAAGGSKPERQKGKAALKPALDPKEKRLTAEKRRQKERHMELEELNEEYRLLKKLKKGSISEREFDLATGIEEADDNAGGGSGAAAAKHIGRPHLSLQAQGLGKKKAKKKKNRSKGSRSQ